MRIPADFAERISRLSFLAVILAFLCGCHNASGVSTSIIQENASAFKRIGVLPFQQVSPDEAARNAVIMKLPASIIKTQNDAETPERTIQDIFWEKLDAHKKFDLVSPDRTGGIFEQAASSSFKISLLEVVQRVGQDLEVDGVAIGYVYRFRERVGYDYSVEKPASVFFEIQLYRCRDGALIWKGLFEKTQTSLMENLYRVSYFLKERGRWIKAKELAAEGMDDILKEFPGLKAVD